jgi:transposase
LEGVVARRREIEDPKVTALREARCLNPHPETVTDEVFTSQEFFDARDAVQVKYEMVRRVRVDGISVSAASEAFGYSRPSFYEAAAALNEQGLDGLVPDKPGPRGGHKITAEICAFAEAQLAADVTLRPADLVAPIAERFGVRVHPRSIERAVARYQDQHSKSR